MKNSAAHVSEEMEKIITGQLPDERIEHFLLELRERGETAEEIAAAVRVMRAHAVKLPGRIPGLLDTCGTGGDSKNTVNVSTISAIVAAACGVKVAKHGNRSVSSVCGSADLLEALGVKINLSPEKAFAALERTNFAFFFAPIFHPAVKHAMNARKKIQGKTLFNILGPLSNPAGADYQVVGVYEPRLLNVVAHALKELGAKRALAVHSKDGMDEISVSAPTEIAELSGGTLKNYTVEPEDFGINRKPISALQADSKEKCKAAALSVLKENKLSAVRDIVLLNAAAALYAATKAASLEEGVAIAEIVLNNGKAAAKLDEIIRVTNGI